MENLLEKVAGMLGGLWDWTVHLNGGLQIVLVLLAVVMSGVCAIVAKRMQSPMMDMGGSVAGRTAVSIAAYVFGVVFHRVDRRRHPHADRGAGHRRGVRAAARLRQTVTSKTNNPAAPIMDAAFPYPGRTGTHRDNDRKGTRRTSWEDSSSRRNIP